MSEHMREIRIEKVTVNIGVGSAGEELEKAEQLIERISSSKSSRTLARKRNPAFKIRRRLPIGVKVILRGSSAEEFLKKALKAKKNKLKKRVFDSTGNFSFGIAEYIDFPGIKYDPDIPVMGFDVCVTLCRPGWRVKYRKRRRSKIGNAHLISREEAMKFAESKLGVVLED